MAQPPNPYGPNELINPTGAPAAETETPAQPREPVASPPAAPVPPLKPAEPTAAPMPDTSASALFDSSRHVDQIFAALAEAQGIMEQPRKTKKATVKGEARGSGREYTYTYWYCDIADVLAACQGAFKPHGLAVTQIPRIEERSYEVWSGNNKTTRLGAMVHVRTIITHKSGQWMSNSINAMAESLGPQALGSVITYLRRYGLQLLAGIAADEDEDGNAGQGEQEGGAGPRDTGAPAQPQGPRRTNGAGPGGDGASVITCAITEVEIKRNVNRAGQSAYRFKTPHGWASTLDEALGQKIAREKGTGLVVRLEVIRSGSHIDIQAATVLPPNGEG